MLNAPPDHVLIAGDWHGNTRWATGIVGLLDSLLPSERTKLIVHLGDFGIWPGRAGTRYLAALDDALDDADAEIWFVDGNHEDHDGLAELARVLGHTPPWREPVPVGERIWWLPRGYRWRWHDRTWLALGGAVSVDRALRVEQRNWWSAEALTDEQIRRAIADGPADVMVCHDAPSSVPLRLPPPSPLWASRDLADSARHRKLVQTVADAVKPTVVLHGHYHLEHHTTVDMPHGSVAVTGLDADGAASGNYRVMDVRTLAFLNSMSR